MKPDRDLYVGTPVEIISGRLGGIKGIIVGVAIYEDSDYSTWKVFEVKPASEDSVWVHETRLVRSFAESGSGI